MRKSKKKELINCVDTLQKGNGKVLKIDSENRVDFLTQCQEMAIMVGTEIDRIEGEGVAAVSFLEQYCEEIYLMSVAVDRGELIQAQKRAHELLLQIKESIQTDIPDSPAEILFLPYKASMWDAMDSVYRAAVADGSCNVTVMPIPYFNISPKGEVLAVEYEGALFPKDIQITDFRDYDLKAMHPDVIFIHNPYDEWNRVTQVPKEFFSSTLVNCTEHLVYIPYFVTKGDTINEDYCYMPAVRNAWRTFVQSEAVRDCYIKSGADPKKIVTLGSPKFDMVLQLQENPPAIPTEWATALKGKKVFLLNTHLNSIINEAEKTIDKLHQLFELFEKREDEALLWRPHPLSIQTAKSMNAQILEAYMQLIEEFKKLPNGVYDDTADLHRAIALSDAYVGDYSSLVTLYGITGKPIYLLNRKGEGHIWQKTEIENLSFSSAVELDGFWWATADDCNGLFKIRIEDEKVSLVTGFEKEAIGATKLYRDIVAYGRKLFCIPYCAKRIAEYQVDTGEMKYYDIPESMQNDLYKFGGYVVEKNELFLFPMCLRDVVCLNMETGEIITYKFDAMELPKEIRNSGISMFPEVIHVENKALLPCMRKNVMICFDLKNSQFEMISIPFDETEGGFVSATCSGNMIYLLGWEGDVFSYDFQTGEKEVFYRRTKTQPEKTMPFSRIIYFDNALWLMANAEGPDCVINIKTRDSRNIDNYPADCQILKKNGTLSRKWFRGDVKEGKLFFYPSAANMILCWENAMKEPVGIKVRYLKDKKWRYYNLFRNQNTYSEEFCSLEEFMDLGEIEREGYEAERKAYFRGLQHGADGFCGKRIWDYVRNDIET